MEVLIGVAGEGQGCEAGFGDVDAELFLQFTDQCGFWALARFDLAAGKFPQAAELLVRWALRQQHAAVLVDQGHGGDEDDLHSQLR